MIKTINSNQNHAQKSGARRLWGIIVLSLITSYFSLLTLQSCTPEPPLHLYDAQEATMDLPMIDMDLEVYWDYEMDFGVEYHWEAEWYYGWDAADIQMFGEIGYTTPEVFQVRRYYTGEQPYAPHTGVIIDSIHGAHYQGMYDYGFWDLLLCMVWLV